MKPTTTNAAALSSLPQNGEDQIKAAAELTTQKAFRSFMKNMPGLCWVVNRQGDFLYMNTGLLRMFGLKRSDVGKNINDLFPSEFLTQYKANNERVFQTGKTISTHEEGLLPNGKKVVFKSIKFLISNSGQQLLGGIAMDITGEIEQQQHYYRELERFQLINKATSEITWDLNLETGERTRGGSIESVFGFKSGIDNEAKDFNHVHPDDRDRVKASFANLLRSGKNVWEEMYRVRCSKGLYHAIINKAFVVRNAEGRAVRMVGAARNISNELMLQEALVAKEKALQQALLHHVVEAQEKERFEIATELHENLAQLLATSGLLMDMAHQTGGQAFMQQSREVLNKALNELRGLQQRLNPENIALLGLRNVLQDLVDKANLRHQEKATLHYDMEGVVLTNRQQVVLFRLVQEQLKNIAQHAGARRVQVALHCGNGQVQLTVSDDGCGFDAAAVPPGLGLKSIASRVAMLGGQWRLITATGEGCQLLASFPLEGEENRLLQAAD